jgi:hypothetical protein
MESHKSMRRLWPLFGRPFVPIVIGAAVVNVLTFFIRSFVQGTLTALAIENPTVRSTVTFVTRCLIVYYGCVLSGRVSEKRQADEIAIDP